MEFPTRSNNKPPTSKTEHKDNDSLLTRKEQGNVKRKRLFPRQGPARAAIL
jgi:hypothetical protein